MKRTQNIKSYNESIYGYILILIVFLVGILNSKIYFYFMGYGSFSKGILTLVYLLLLFSLFIIIVNNLFRRFINVDTIHFYWLIICFAIILKLIILFIQFPGTFSPGARNYDYFLPLVTNLLLMGVLILGLKKFNTVKHSVWYLGIGASFSALIPLFFYPNMIGKRHVFVDGFEFTGAFWNSAVISYISICWLLIALLPYEKRKIKRNIILLIFLLILFAGLSGLSRALVFSLVASMFTYLLIANKLQKYLKTMILTLIVLLILYLSFQDLIDSFSARLGTGVNLSNESRTDIWGIYIDNITDYFWFGEIEGNYKKYTSTEHGPHSVLLNWLVQFGIIGLIGFILLISGIIKSILRISKVSSRETVAALYAWLVAYLSIALINETGFNDLSLFAAIGIIYAWGIISKTNYTNINSEK